MKLFDKCKRNYFGFRENHKCTIYVCKGHEWWCQLHLGRILECDCYCDNVKCQVCRENESSHQYSNETGYFCCYGCWLAQRDVTP